MTITPERVLDTRVDLGLPGRSIDAIPRELQVTGPVAIAPSGTETVVPTDAIAVLANVSVVRASDPGYLALRPGGASGVPSTSTVNFQADVNTRDSATADLGPGGTIQIYLDTLPDAGNAHVLLDVVRVHGRPSLRRPLPHRGRDRRQAGPQGRPRRRLHEGSGRRRGLRGERRRRLHEGRGRRRAPDDRDRHDARSGLQRLTTMLYRTGGCGSSSTGKPAVLTGDDPGRGDDHRTLGDGDRRQHRRCDARTGGHRHRERHRPRRGVAHHERFGRGIRTVTATSVAPTVVGVDGIAFLYRDAVSASSLQICSVQITCDRC